jgi:hypothetical protein
MSVSIARGSFALKFFSMYCLASKFIFEVFGSKN